MVCIILLKLIKKNFRCARGSKYSVYVAIVGENGGLKVCESSELRKCVSISPCFPEADFLVYRAFDEAYAKEASDWAIDLASNFQIKYSIDGLTSSIRCNTYDEASKIRQKVLAQKKMLPKMMMSGQFVVASYQCRIDEPYIRLNSLYISPMELEDFINKTSELFYFYGKITHFDAQRFNLEYYKDRNLQNESGDNIFSPRVREREFVIKTSISVSELTPVNIVTKKTSEKTDISSPSKIKEEKTQNRKHSEKKSSEAKLAIDKTEENGEKQVRKKLEYSDKTSSNHSNHPTSPKSEHNNNNNSSNSSQKSNHNKAHSRSKVSSKMEEDSSTSSKKSR